MYAKYKLIKIYDTESLHHFTNVTRNTVIVYIYENNLIILGGLETSYLHNNVM